MDFLHKAPSIPQRGLNHSRSFLVQASDNHKISSQGGDGADGDPPLGGRRAEYCELQITTNFSFLRGASHPDEIAFFINAILTIFIYSIFFRSYPDYETIAYRFVQQGG